MKITIANKEVKEDIKTVNTKTIDELSEIAYQFIESICLEKSVVLIFVSHLEENNLTNSNVFLVSNIWDYLIDFIDTYTDVDNIYKDLNLYILEFENYREAFKYCLDYKEGFDINLKYDYI